MTAKIKIFDPEDYTGIPNTMEVIIDLPIPENLAQQLIEPCLNSIAQTARATITVEDDRLMVGASLGTGLSDVIFDFDHELENPNHLSKSDAAIVIASDQDQKRRLALHRLLAASKLGHCRP